MTFLDAYRIREIYEIRVPPSLIKRILEKCDDFNLFGVIVEKRKK